VQSVVPQRQIPVATVQVPPALQLASPEHWHAPALQTKPGGQAWPQAPQLVALVMRSMQPAGV
jgi:hypothetical protein